MFIPASPPMAVGTDWENSHTKLDPKGTQKWVNSSLKSNKRIQMLERVNLVQKGR